jgi:uncharacterized protein YndB with AHSA1/START domain
MSFSVQKDIAIAATAAQVWHTLVTPALIKKYLYGTDTVSDWEEGSSILFKGEYEGVPYTDKGTILSLQPNKVLKYSYLSSFANLEDRPENYAILTFDIQEISTGTLLKLTQENILSEESAQHAENSWEMVLQELKKVAEAL